MVRGSYSGDWVGIIGGLIALAALIYSVFTNFQSKEIRELNKTLERRAKSIDLEDIRNFCDDIADKMEGWTPDVIYCPDLRGAFVAYLFARQKHYYVPILIGYIFSKAKPVIDVQPNSRFKPLHTPAYHILVDIGVYEYRGQKVLVIDELAITGEAIHEIKRDLVDNGFQPEAIKSCVIVACSAAETSGRRPDYVWRMVERSDITFPWGRWK
jgi:hypoxanthine phosphoribosyltransferase